MEYCISSTKKSKKKRKISQDGERKMEVEDIAQELEGDHDLKEIGESERKKKRGKERKNKNSFESVSVDIGKYDDSKIKQKRKRTLELNTNQDDQEVVKVKGKMKSESYAQLLDIDELMGKTSSKLKKERKKNKKSSNISEDHHLVEGQPREGKKGTKKKTKEAKAENIERNLNDLDQSEFDQPEMNNKARGLLVDGGRNNVEGKKKKEKTHESHEVESEVKYESNNNNMGPGEKKVESKEKEKKKKRKKSKDVGMGEEDYGIPKKKGKEQDAENMKKTANQCKLKGSITKLEESLMSPAFESEERQERFQRILGGKKSLSIKERVISSGAIDSKIHIEKETAIGNINNSVEKHSTSTGQWNGMMFESSERQNKFIRLLGGAKSNTDKKKALFSSNTSGTTKKGLFGSLLSGGGCRLNAGANKNMALDLHGAASLNESLEDDYNRALNKRLGGLVSAGIGFVKDPADGKTFHINRNVTKSTKFSDDDE